MSRFSERLARIRTLPPERLRHRALDPRRELTASGLVFAAMFVPFLLGTLLGTVPSDAPLEGRVAWVLSMASALVLAAWCVQREAEGRARFYPLGALVIPFAHLVTSGSPFWASLNAVLFLGVGAFVGTRAPLRFLLRHHSSTARTRLAAVFLLFATMPGPLITIGWGLGSDIVVPAIVRLVHPTPGLRGEERLTDFQADDGLTLRGTYFPGLPGAPAVVLAHGLGDGRDRMLGWARALNARGAHVLAYDARGHAASDGAVITYADREPGDVVRAVIHLQSLSGTAGSDVAVLGESMGGGAVTASLPAVSALGVHRAVLFAPASDYAALVAERIPSALGPIVRWMIFLVSRGMGFRAPTELIPAQALDEAPNVAVLIIHSRADATIPAELTEHMASGHDNVTVRWMADVGHNGLETVILNQPSMRTEVMHALGVEP